MRRKRMAIGRKPPDRGAEILATQRQGLPSRREIAKTSAGAMTFGPGAGVSLK